MKVKFGGKFFQTKSLSARLSHKVCRLLSSPVLVRVLYIPSPQSAVPIFLLPDLKRFTLLSILLQGFNKSLITSEKTFSLFVLKTARRTHTEHSFTTRRPPSCLQSRHFRFYSVISSSISPTYSAKRLEESDMLFYGFG